MMESKHRNRKVIRLQNYNYSQKGAYFITICTADRKLMFGTVEDGKIALNETGLMAAECLTEINRHIKCCRVSDFVIMPNHIHFILWIDDQPVGTPYMVSEQKDLQLGEKWTPYMVSLQEKSKQTVSKTVQQFKAAVTRKTGRSGLWQPRFYDHMIRNQNEYAEIIRYIAENPQRWQMDKYYISSK